MKNDKDKFIAGQLFINTGLNDDGIPFDVYLGEHMTIIHKAGYVWIGLPYNKRSNYNDNFEEKVGNDENDHSSELREFFGMKTIYFYVPAKQILTKKKTISQLR